MEPLDLLVTRLRSPHARFPGIDLVMLARTVDKMRALLPGGNIAGYQIKGFSARLFAELSIDENIVQQVIAEAQDEEEFIAWFAAHTDPDAYPAINVLLASVTIGQRDRAGLEERYPCVRDMADDDTLFDMLDRDDDITYASLQAP